MTLTNKHNLPQPIVDAIMNHGYSRGESDITVTQLIDPPQLVALKEIHKDEIEEDVSDMMFALMGSAVHNILEKAETTMPVEERLYVQRRGWKVGGQFDRMALLGLGACGSDGIQEVELQDYKTAGVYAVQEGKPPKREWLAQLNLLSLLIRENVNYSITKLTIVAILRDWSKSKIERTAGYPDASVKMVDVPIWTHVEVEDYLDQRVELHQRAQREGLWDPCTPEERWEQPGSWKVLKEGRKTALRVLSTKEEAQQWMEENTPHAHKGITKVEYFPGRNTRCEDWCPVVRWCEQAKGLGVEKALLGREENYGS